MTISYYCATAFLIGTAVGLSELLSRYAWTFRDIVKLSAGLTYLGLNGLVAVVGYLAAVQWNLLSALHDRNELWRVLAISLLAMAALRSAFANIRVGGKEVAAGLASFIEIFLRRAERELDQKLGFERLNAIADALEGLTYSATKDFFLAMTEGVLRSLTKPDVEGLQNDVAKIDALEVDDTTKMALLGMRIVERTNLSLFVSLAQRAKVQLAPANKLATEAASDRLEKLLAAKNRLQ